MPTGNPGQPRRARPGRPSELHTIVGQRTRKRADGTTELVDVTRIDRILEAIRTGLAWEDVAAREQIAVATFRGWRRVAHEAQRDLAIGAVTDDGLSDYQAECIEFLSGVEAAEADAKLLAFGLAERLAQGGAPVETIVERYTIDEDGTETLVSRQVTRTATLPSEAMLRWRIDRRWPGAPTRVELSGPDGAPIAVEQREQATSLADTLERYLIAQAEEEAAARRAQRAAARRAKNHAGGNGSNGAGS